jgi:hypothetical protein
MDATNIEQLRRIFAASLNTFAADPTVAHFGRYRVASLALDVAREFNGTAGGEGDEDVARGATPGAFFRDFILFLIPIPLVMAAVTFAAYYLGR